MESCQTEQSASENRRKFTDWLVSTPQRVGSAQGFTRCGSLRGSKKVLQLEICSLQLESGSLYLQFSLHPRRCSPVPQLLASQSMLEWVRKFLCLVRSLLPLSQRRGESRQQISHSDIHSLCWKLMMAM